MLAKKGELEFKAGKEKRTERELKKSPPLSASAAPANN